MTMKYTACLLMLVCTMATTAKSYAQQHAAKEENAAKKPAATGKKFILPYVYLGNSQYKGGQIRKEDFDALLKLGLTAHDSLGNRYKVVGFEFSYGEKSLYEDSIGNNMVVTDYLTEFCPGDTVTQAVSSSIYQRTKPGDSAYFDGIRVLKYLGNSSQTVPAKETTLGMGMKFAIIK
jgi:hypothetical protein